MSRWQVARYGLKAGQLDTTGYAIVAKWAAMFSEV